MAINTQELRKAYEIGIEAVAILVENEVKRLSEKPKNHPPSNQPSKSMFTELNTSIPSVRRVHKMIQGKEEVEIKLVTGDSITGTVKWIDSDCICIAGTVQAPVQAPVVDTIHQLHISVNGDAVAVSPHTLVLDPPLINNENQVVMEQEHSLVIWQHAIAFIKTVI
jgi:sRNA-binding regulator protein Hfq